MPFITLSQGKRALVDSDDHKKLSSRKWWLGPRGRYAVSQDGRRTIYMHQEIMPTEKGMYVDHINGNNLDNRKQNLRICEHRMNRANSSLSKNNTTGYKGVHFDSRYGTWSARIGVNNKKIHLGTFDNPKSAAIAYNNAARKYWGDFANLNSV